MDTQKAEQVRWDRFKKSHFVSDLEVLFSQDMDEEILFPIIHTFFLFSLGKLSEVSEYDLKELEKAFQILEDHDAAAE